VYLWSKTAVKQGCSPCTTGLRKGRGAGEGGGPTRQHMAVPQAVATEKVNKASRVSQEHCAGVVKCAPSHPCDPAGTPMPLSVWAVDDGRRMLGGALKASVGSPTHASTGDRSRARHALCRQVQRNVVPRGARDLKQRPRAHTHRMHGGALLGWLLGPATFPRGLGQTRVVGHYVPRGISNPSAHTP